MCSEIDGVASADGQYAKSADGHFIGVKTENGAAVFRGIVYARYERFGMPAEAKPWGCGPAGGTSRGTSDSCGDTSPEPGGVYDARKYGCVCPQNLSHLLGQLGPDSGLEMREGELCLSVTVPGAAEKNIGSDEKPLETKENCDPGVEFGASEKKGQREEHGRLPVMVWIHGGFYLTGGSEDHRYDVSRLAQAGNVIVVKISYRLGAEGYMWMPEKGIANLGLEDQKTALRWIRRHIASFGGDPDNVTVFGQSAGAHSIASLIASADDVEQVTNVPRFGGEPLFHRAILQSPPLGNTITPKAAAKVTDAFLDKLSEIAGLGNEPGETARERGERCLDAAIAGNGVTLEQIIAAQDAVKSMRLGLIFLPVLRDCMRIPPVGTPSSDGKCRFRVLLGYNADDASPYIRKWAGFLWKTPLRRPLVKLLTDMIFRKPTLRYAAKLRAAGIEASTYCIGWHPQGSELGACHSIELPFLLGNYGDWTEAEMLRGMTRGEFDGNSSVIQRLWTEFARSGEFPKNNEIL